MVKQIFIILLCLIGINTGGFGQVDSLESAKEYGFLGNGIEDYPYFAVEFGGGHFKFKNDLISSDIYSGNGPVFECKFGIVDFSLAHFLVTFGLDVAPRIKTSTVSENPEIAAFQELKGYSRFNAKIQFEKQLFKSNHFFGVYINTFGSPVRTKVDHTNPYLFTSLPVTTNGRDDLLTSSFGPSYLYAGRVFGKPIMINALASIPVSIAKTRSVYYAFKGDFVFYEHFYGISVALTYDWNYEQVVEKSHPPYSLEWSENSIGISIMYTP